MSYSGKKRWLQNASPKGAALEWLLTPSKRSFGDITGDFLQGSIVPVLHSVLTLATQMKQVLKKVLKSLNK